MDEAEKSGNCSDLPFLTHRRVAESESPPEQLLSLAANKKIPLRCLAA
jgi:hypothetical protein